MTGWNGPRVELYVWFMRMTRVVQTMLNDQQTVKPPCSIFKLLRRSNYNGRLDNEYNEEIMCGLGITLYSIRSHLGFTFRADTLHSHA